MRPLRGSLVSLLALSVAGCGGGGSSGTPSGSGSTPPPSLSMPLSAPPADFETAEYMQSGALHRLHASYAYAAGGDGAGIDVAVIDTGIDVDHPELVANIHAASRDVVARATPDLDDVGGHGTAVAGVIAASRNNLSVHGIAPEAKLIAIRADREGTCPSACTFNQDDLATATDYAVAQGAEIINYSLAASSLGTNFRNALIRAANAGRLLVIAAGNQAFDNPQQPGGFAANGALGGRALVVGALDTDDSLASFSNRAGSAKSAYITAPGVSVGTTTMGGGEGFASGTSFAAPLVSGAAALILDLAPHLKAEEVVSLLLATADDQGAPGVDEVYGYGMLNLEAALSPSGSLVVAGGERVDGGGAELADTHLGLSTVFGDQESLSRNLADAVAFDALGRAYSAGLNTRLVRNTAPSPLASWLSPRNGSAATDAYGPMRLAFATHEAPTSAQGAEHPTTFSGEVSLGSRTRVSAALNARPEGLGATETGLSTLRGALAHLDLAANGGFVIDHRLAGPWSVQTGLVDGRLGTDDEDRRGFMTSLRYRLGETGYWRFALGRLTEEEGALGSEGTGAFGGLPAADTTLAGLDLGMPLMEDLGFQGGFGIGVTAPRRAKSGLIRETGRLVSTAFGAALVTRDLVLPGDRLAFGLSQPLRVENGSIGLSVPTGRDTKGNVRRERRTARAAPRGREFDLEVAYSRPLQAGSLDVRALLRLEPGHDAAADPEFGLGLRWHLRLPPH